MEPSIPVEQHPLQPFLPSNAKLLMLGSFPPAQKRWCMHFYYPNFNNDMWRIFGLAFFGQKDYFVSPSEKRFDQQRIIDFLMEKGIAIFDTATAIRRSKNTASDKDLEIVQPTDLDALLHRIPLCRAIVTTGQKATDTFVAHFEMTEPKVGAYSDFLFEGRSLRLYRMPSSSRAYPMKVERKAEFYKPMFLEALSAE
jgi:hypoxanthine-DNA glycosylase